MPVGPKRVRPEVTKAVERAAELALELKATDVVALDLASIWGATDYFLLVSGRSDVQVKAIAENIVDQLKKEEIRPEHVEGLQGGRWVLIHAQRRRLKDALSTRNLTRPPLPPEARARLLPVFRQDIIKLQDMLGRDLSGWLK